MKEYSVILFDLDGTLSDPTRGLVESYYYGLTKMGIVIDDKASLSRFIGPPLFEEWQDVYGFSPEQANSAIALFREYFSVYGWWDNKLYPGIKELLAHLKGKGKRIALATSKPEIFARKILKFFAIDEYFDFVGAATLDTTRHTKWQVIDYTLKQMCIEDRESVIIVGDRKYDAEGAAICGIDSLGVLYGHGTREEIESAGFTYVANTVEDLIAVIK